MPPGALKPSASDMRHYDERQQAAQPAVEQQVYGKMAMREESMEDLNNNMNAVNEHLDVPINGGKLLSSSSRPALDDNGKPVLRVQRTQLLNLQPAGGKKNQSSTNVDQPNVEVLDEEDLEKMSSHHMQETASQATAKA